MNPVNDFYMQNAMAQQNQAWLPFPQQQNQLPRIVSRFVTSIEEAKAAMIDGYSYNLFLDSSTGKIYLKKLSNNGVAEFLCFSPEENKPTDPFQEINLRLSKIESLVGGLNDKSISSGTSIKQSEPVYQPAVTEQNERHDETESAGLPKNAGNGWRKK